MYLQNVIWGENVRSDQYPRWPRALSNSSGPRFNPRLGQLRVFTSNTRDFTCLWLKAFKKEERLDTGVSRPSRAYKVNVTDKELSFEYGFEPLTFKLRDLI